MVNADVTSCFVLLNRIPSTLLAVTYTAWVTPVCWLLVSYLCFIYFNSSFLVEKDPAANATDAPQSWGFLCNPMIKTKMNIIFCPFQSNGAPVEWNRQMQKYQGETCPSATLCTINATWTDPGSKPGLRGDRPAANRLSHGAAPTVIVTLHTPQFLH
jgi:hypothetical protein